MLNMVNIFLIVNLLVVAVVTQDMPPPDLEIPTTIQNQISTTSDEAEMATTTTEPINTITEKVLTLLTEAITKTVQPIMTTLEQETTPSAIEEITTTPSKVQTITNMSSEQTTTTISIPTTAPSTIRDHVPPASPTTDYPFLQSSASTTSTQNFPLFPSYPNFFDQKCYFKKQYGNPQVRWSCMGLQYVYPIECFKCCLFEFSSFAGCYRVHGYDCIEKKNGIYKRQE